jgi:uncharacterized damage-inducible protein DinB
VSPRRIALTATGLAAFGRWPLAWALQLVNDRGIRHRGRVEVALRDAGGCVDLIARRPS